MSRKKLRNFEISDKMPDIEMFFFFSFKNINELYFVFNPDTWKYIPSHLQLNTQYFKSHDRYMWDMLLL